MAKQSVTTKAVERWKEEMPVEQEMLPKDNYTLFDRKETKYRKGIQRQCSIVLTEGIHLAKYCSRTAKVDESNATNYPS